MDVGDRIKSKTTNKIGVIVKYRKLPFLKNTVTVKLDSGEHIILDDLSGWMKIIRL